MSRICFLVLLITPFLVLHAQNTLPISETIKNEQPDYQKLDSIAKVLGLKGGDNVRVSTRFAVNEQGKIVDIQVRGPHSYFENESIRILKKVPILDPALKNGKPIKTQFSLPINFRIETKMERKRRLSKEKKTKD